MVQDSLGRLEKTLGYTFQDRTLLALALTHSSRRPELRYSNERLEFLGDAILGAAVSEHLYRRFPDYAEGPLTRIKSIVVSRASLARAAKDLNLDEHLIVAKGVACSISSGAEDAPACHTLPVSLISNAFEAIIGAVYLDGGWAVSHDFVLRHMHGQIERACKAAIEHNYKSVLQEVAQRDLGATPSYRVTSETGPDHVKTFEVVTVIGEERYGIGHGRTKKAAEQMAAELTLAMLKKRAALNVLAESVPPEE